MILHNSIRVAQNLSRRNSHAQIKLGDMPSLNNRIRLTYGHRNPLNHLNYLEMRELASNEHEKYSGSWQNNVKRGSEVPTNNVESCNGSAFLLYEGNQQRTVLYRNPDLAYERVVPQSHEVNQAAKRYAQNRPFLRESVDGIAGSNPFQPFGSSFASLRWRRLISPCMAELMNCPVLSPGFFTCSMPSMISCAMRAVTDCDFAFFEPVAMSTFSKNECKTLYTKIYCLEVLTCKTPLPYRVSYTLFELRCENSEARQCGNTNRASDHQDS